MLEKQAVPRPVEAEGHSAHPSPQALREMHLFLRLAREWDLRFERLVRLGAVSKWYSAVGNEAITVAAATAIAAGDALVSLHRDSGAILRYYVDASRLFPDQFPPLPGRRAPPTEPRELLYRLACQMLGKADGFSGGRERSYHYSFFHEEAGIIHVGMISHLGAMIPVAAGVALALKQAGGGRVALNFIGEGGTSTGDFHEGLNMAAVYKAPLVLIIQNNGYAFSTPSSEQYASRTLAERGPAYGVPGVRVDGTDALAVLRCASEAVARARAGKGPTLIEAVVGRMRGHSEGDDSFLVLSEDERRRSLEADPVLRFERTLLESGAVTHPYLDQVAKRCAELVLATVDRALASRDPDPSSLPGRVHAG
ncbi:MAG: thiamine pyrophosphate-dependent dehydrogenase E1 component subunit alpha [Planctomycetes bacterium]|nr:thiamine pyrophosphate-dependent dehydrogenase E1 component subunit alpha [Planctomycetota bacterium]